METIEEIENVVNNQDLRLFAIVGVVLVIFYSVIMYVISDSDTDRKLKLKANMGKSN